jgi:uncharacterized protein (TIGR03435 family)
MRSLLGVFLLASSLCAQRPEFDVASVKVSEPAAGDTININLGTVRHGELTLGNATLVECVRFAYGLVSDDQVASPEWAKSRENRYDIIAKSAPDTPRERMLEMLQTLLDDRFKLAMHREPKVLAHYELAIAKGGVKMHPAAPEAGTETRFASLPLHRIASHNMPMFRFVMLLSRQLRQAVLDNTGLTGGYEVDLQWTEEESGQSIFSAIQDQLGLKLEPRKSPVEILVIDKAEKVPVAN